MNNIGVDTSVACIVILCDDMKVELVPEAIYHVR